MSTVLMDSLRGGRGRGMHRPQSRNKQWVASDAGAARPTSGHGSDIERWERGGHRGGTRGRGRGHTNMTWRPGQPTQTAPQPHGSAFATDGTHHAHEEEMDDADGGATDVEADANAAPEIEEPELNTREELEAFYQELVKAREVERQRAIREGKLDDPNKPKLLKDAIDLVGTCPDMCPRFERYRRQRENNLDRLEMIPGTKRVDHRRAVKMYERAPGDKILPSDVRPPPVLKRTLDYLFHHLLAEPGFAAAHTFVRDRSRAVRIDITLQHLYDALAIECHDRCARFHILAIHFLRSNPGFSIPLEEQQLMYTLTSLREFHSDTRREKNPNHEGTTELEMRVYHRLIHMRDQVERHDDLTPHVRDHPVFGLTTAFRRHVQQFSAPITKTSALKVGPEGMQIFAELARVLREQGSVVMVYLVACILERHFGPETIENIEAIRGDMSIADVIDGISPGAMQAKAQVEDEIDGFVDDANVDMEEEDELAEEEESHGAAAPSAAPTPFGTFSTAPAVPPVRSAFAALATKPNVFGSTAVFGGSASAFGGGSTSGFGGQSASANPSTNSPFGQSTPTTTSTSVFRRSPSTTNIFASSTSSASPSLAATPNLKSPSPFGKSLPSASPFGAPSKAGNIFGTPVLAASPSATKPPASSHLFAPVPATTSLNPAAPAFTPPNRSAAHVATPSQPSASTSGSAFGTPSGAPIPRIFATPPAANPFSPQPQSLSASKTLWTIPGSHAPSVPSPLKIDTVGLGIVPQPFPNTPPIPPPATGTLLGGAPGTPVIPPPMERRQPLSLPPTPTLTALPGGVGGALRPQPSLLNFPKMSPMKQASATDILSPLVPPSPGGFPLSSSFPFGSAGSPDPALAASTSTSASPVKSPLSRLPSAASVNGNGKGKGKERAMDPDDAAKVALEFARRGCVVKQCFQLWLKRTIDQLDYAEACRRSDAYSQKVHRQRVFSRTNSSEKRKASTPATSPEREPLHKRRAKARVSSGYRAPQTDEDLARRFKENQEEHDKRWAPGSFLRTVRTYVKRASGSWPRDWQLWLSANPENDGTAIWVDRKFDVPAAGAWHSEAVFAIPAPEKQSGWTLPSPGLVVFECTPLEGVDDELERKYRTLDDCSRLRDVLAAFPTERRFVPSVLLIIWGDQPETSIPPDLQDMMKKCSLEGIISTFDALVITATTKDLDARLSEAIVGLSLDMKGDLVQPLTFEGLYRQFLEGSYGTFSSEWASKCSEDYRFNWPLYAQLLQSTVGVLNNIARLALRVWGVSTGTDPLPMIDTAAITDSETAYTAVSAWLDQKPLQSAASFILSDLDSHRSAGGDFPTSTFLEHLSELTLSIASSRIRGKPQTVHAVPKVHIATALEDIEAVIEDYSGDLREIPITVDSPPSSTGKRRADDGDHDLFDFSPPLRESGSANGFKRQRTGANGSVVVSPTPSPAPSHATIATNGTHDTVSVLNGFGGGRSVSPTESATTTVDGEARPLVTVAMLRALTRDARLKYGGAKK